ncbi:MAG: DUF4199 domain-containing protein [bacterium]
MKTSLILILKNSWPYGLILGGTSILISLLLYIFDVNMFSITFAIFSFVVILIGIPVTFGVLGCNNLRTKHANERTIAYLDAVMTCLVIFLIGFLLSNLYNYVFNKFLDPGYMKAQMQKLVEMLDKYNLPQDKIDETIANSEKGFQPLRMLITSGIVSAVLSLIISIFIRKKDKFEETI